ncbi:response regulator [Paractinoplanes durhamensis]|uniref:response regulator n=1 Tax=Paractinoplanes durhamensis TaxID=113563 RepID=UPI001EF2F4F7|nr:response regulator [Actinoplanes durhamensis]
MVLVVDDEEDLRDIMRRMLERRGFSTLVAASANEALQLCRDHPGAIDIVLADLGLPNMGHEFADSAAVLRPDARTVFMSGLPRDLAIAEGVITEYEMLMKKPFSTEELIDALRALSEFSTRWKP